LKSEHQAKGGHLCRLFWPEKQQQILMFKEKNRGNEEEVSFYEVGLSSTMDNPSWGKN